MPAPTRLGKYEVRRELGKGSMGVVYEAFDPFIERRVAIKVIREDELSPGANRDLLARLKREAQAAGRLNHPGIVAIYDYGEEDATQGDSGLAYIAMELIDGRELKDYFDADHQFSTQDVVRVMEEVLAALQHAHERGVTHRDIKPSNVILLRNGRVKVADFGVARLDTSELTQAGTMIGTPMYMSPEQILGLPVDGRADLFSCGVVLYQFLTGEKPFTGSIATVMQKVLHHNPPPVTQLNNTLAPAWDGVLRTALAKKPEDRYPSAAAMIEAIRRAALEPAPGQKDEVTVLLPRPAAGVTLPPLTAPMPGRLAQTLSTPKSPQQSGNSGGPGRTATNPAVNPPTPAPGSKPSGSTGPDGGSATGRPPQGMAGAGANDPARISAGGSGQSAAQAAHGAGSIGATPPPAPPGGKPAVSPTWSAPGTGNAASGSSRAAPYLGSQGTSTSALATVVANALSSPSATLKPPAPPPPPPPSVAPRLGVGPRAVALAAVVGGAALAAYLAWPTGKRPADGGTAPPKPAASQPSAASRSVAAPAPLPSDLSASQTAAASASAPAAVAAAPGPSPAPTTIAQASPGPAQEAAKPRFSPPAAPASGSTPAPKPPPAPPPLANVTPSPAPAPTPAPAPAQATAQGPAAFSQEWRPRLAKLEAQRGLQSMAAALAVLLDPLSPEERALAVEFETQFKQRPMPSALVVGVVDGHFRSNWQTRGQSAERAMEQARKRCFEQAVAGCSVVLLNGEFQRDAFLTAARELGAQPPSAVRARVLRSFERSLSEWRQADGGARAASANTAYVTPAPPPVAASPAPAPARSAEQLAAEAARAEWSQALTSMRSESPSNFSRGVELLLRTSGEDNDRLSRFQSALKRMRWNSAVAMGEKNGYLVFAWSHSERRSDWAQERALADCNRASSAPCAVVMADGSYANNGLMSVGARLGSHNQQAVRENFMRYVQRKLQEGLG